MIRCLDIHTHHPAPQPEGVISMGTEDFHPMEGQFYSVGIHPWSTKTDLSPEEWTAFKSIVSRPEVVAIGECGVDLLKGGPLFRQLQIMKRQVEISEEIGKPLIIHDVKAHDIILGLKRDLKPEQKWMVHGFRGKPTLARMLTDAGIWISLGERYNPETLTTMPQEMLLAETDESPKSIEEIISGMSEILEFDLTETILRNSSRFLGMEE